MAAAPKIARSATVRPGVARGIFSSTPGVFVTNLRSLLIFFGVALTGVLALGLFLALGDTALVERGDFTPGLRGDLGRFIGDLGLFRGDGYLGVFGDFSFGLRHGDFAFEETTAGDFTFGLALTGVLIFGLALTGVLILGLAFAGVLTFGLACAGVLTLGLEWAGILGLRLAFIGVLDFGLS